MILQEQNNMLLIDFPEKTAKEIIGECNNKVGEGKLVWSTDSWYKNEDFYTKEKSRTGKRWVSKELAMMGMSWNACDRSLKEDGDEMLNFAETLWFLKTYIETFKEYPDDLNYSWTSSRSSYGSLVYVGRCASDGVRVGRGSPGGSLSRLGVRFSRSSPVGAKAVQSEVDSIEILIKKVKKAGYKVYKEM